MSAWSDPRVVELSSEFVATTDEVWRLQRCTDAECVIFQDMANKGHYGKRPGKSRQGIYICTASGKLLASGNTSNPDRVLELLKDGLAAWQKLPESEKRLASDVKQRSKHRWEDSYPKDGLVLNMFARDLPATGKPSEQPTKKWNKDIAWFSANEARQWLPKNLRETRQHLLPRPLVERLVRMHMIDMVKGQALLFRPKDVSSSSNIKVTVTNQNSNRVDISIRGQTRVESNRTTKTTSIHGVSTQLVGSASFDLNRSAFTKFELVAVGKRWGYARHNGRRNDPQEGPIGFVFQLASPNDPLIAPGFVLNYKADWIKHPDEMRDAMLDPMSVFESHDANKDGRLSNPELFDSLRSKVKVFDVNKDGAIDKEEFELGLRKVFDNAKRPF